MSSPQQITILGAGAWGTAVATLLAHNGHCVTLWCYEPEVAQEINTHHTNARYLPHIMLSPLITATSSLTDALRISPWIFEAIPVKFLRAILTQAKTCQTDLHTWIFLSKGIEQTSLKLPIDIYHDIFGNHKNLAVVGGPNFAKELAEKIPSATTVAAEDLSLAQQVAQLMANEYFKPYIANDMAGIQVGGAVKNVLALAIGIARGAGYQENTIAFLLTQGLAEITKLAHHFGGKKETIYGLAGLGDMILTCTGTLSKNLRLGTLLGQGIPLTEAPQHFSTIPEGINTIQSLQQLMVKHALHLPICQGTYEFIFEKKSFKNMLYKIMNRAPEKEFD